MDFSLDTADLIIGVITGLITIGVGLFAVARWCFCKNRAQEKGVKSPKAISIRLNLDNTCLEIQEDIEQIASDLALATKSNQSKPVEIVYPELDSVRKSVKKGQKRGDDVIDLAGFIKEKEARAVFVADVVESLFSDASLDIWGSYLSNTEKRGRALAGIFQAFSNKTGDGTESTKLDVWRTDSPQRSAPIWISSEELEELMKSRNISSKEQLGLGADWISGDELPAKTIVSRVIPSILVSLCAPWNKVDGDEFEKALSLYSWHVGLG
tara:strand:+ start:2315 stop:3118 length:804 start_codon:yes stop_codon:yes gene_type:complete